MLMVPGTTLQQVPAPERQRDANAIRLERDMVANGSLHAEVWRMGDCKIIVAREQQGRQGQFLWHLSISASNRYPTWDEIKTARYALLPDELCFALFLPPADQYVDLVDGSGRPSTVFHMWETHDDAEPWYNG